MHHGIFNKWKTLAIRLVFTLLITCFLLGPNQTANAAGASYFVATNGSDSNPGTQNQPWKTIQKAVDSIQPGDTIFVRAGTYSGATIRNSGSASAVKKLTRYQNETVVIDGGGSVALIVKGGNSYWTFEGLTFKSTNRYTLQLGWWGESLTNNLVVRSNKIYGSSITIGNNNLFEGNDVDGTGYNGSYGDAGLSDASTSHHNTFRNNYVHDFRHKDARGIWTQGFTHDNVIVGNTITNINASSGLGQCIDLDGAAKVEWRHTVANNKMSGCSYVGIQLENVFDSYVENNTIENAGSAGIIVISYSSSVGCLTGGENNQYGDRNGDKSCEGDPTNNYIQQNLIIARSGGWKSGYGGIVNWRAGALKIRGNTIYSASGSGNGAINFQGDAAKTSNSVVKGNIIYPGSGVAICALDFASFAEDAQNLVYRSGDNRVYGKGSGCTSTYTLAQYQSQTGKGQNSIQADPMFVNAGGGDYHLQPGSPAVDKGANIGIQADLDGVTRPQGGGYDMGVYERGGVAAPAPTQTSPPASTPTTAPTQQPTVAAPTRTPIQPTVQSPTQTPAQPTVAAPTQTPVQPTVAAPTQTQPPQNPTATAVPQQPTTPPQGQGMTLEFRPVGDAYVSAREPEKNFGTSIFLNVRPSPEFRSYLLFDVKGLNGKSIQKATLQIRSNVASSVPLTVLKALDTSWTEKQLTYKNMPALGDVKVNGPGSFKKSETISIDVTQLVQSEGLLSLAVLLEKDANLSFASKEIGSSGPKLIIVTNP